VDDDILSYDLPPKQDPADPKKVIDEPYVEPFAYMNDVLTAMLGRETTVFTKVKTSGPELSGVKTLGVVGHEGYEVTNAFAQCKPNKITPFSKHVVRLSHRDFLDTLNPADERPEIVIVNSHDGSSSFRIMAGIFRLICSNGLIVADDKTADERVCHWKSHTLDDVITCSLNVAERAKQSYEIIEQMKATNLTEKQQKEYAEKAANIRLAYNKNSKVNYAENLLIPHRHADNLTPSVWNTYNVVQENCIKGGQLVGSRILRPLTNIGQNVEVNRKLWNEATKLVPAQLVA
jgi:hypothetical protein